MTARRGIVYLVGAGPGDPGLLTVRALELIRAAEVVAYDELISPAIITLIPPGAERLSVGRRHGQGQTSYRLHPEVLARALGGGVVVRLKAGDPLVFGRGAEEAEELAAAGVLFEIVPGISAALGAAAYAGIPLTDRRHASSVTLATGHAAGRARPGAGRTLVLFMAAHRLGENLGRLIAAGRRASTPAAYIAAATTPAQRVVVGTLADLAQRVSGIDPAAPALVIVGDVVALRERIGWFERRPLSGRKILVARARPGPSQIAAELRAAGAQVAESPVVSVAEVRDSAPLDRALSRLEQFSGVVFGCASGVSAVAARLEALGLGGQRLGRRPLVAVGDGAREALRATGLEPAFALRGACRQALLDAGVALRSGLLLFVTSEEGRPGLLSELSSLGATVETVAAYRHLREFPKPFFVAPDVVVLPSSSAARALLLEDDGDGLLQAPMFAIGPRTEAEARRLGARRVLCAAEDSVASLVARVIEEVGAAPAPVR